MLKKNLNFIMATEDPRSIELAPPHNNNGDDNKVEEHATLMNSNITSTNKRHYEQNLSQIIFSHPYTPHIFAIVITISFTGIILLFLLVVPALPSSAPKNVPAVHPNSSLIYKGFTRYTTWFEANQLCQKMGWRLAESGEQVTNENVFQECKSERCWLGASDLETEGRWVWAGSGSLVSTDISNRQQWWKHGTPDNGMGQEDEDCMYMYGQLYGKKNLHTFWNDKSCTNRLSGYVCQRDTNVELTSDCKGYTSQLECPISNFTNLLQAPPKCPSLESVRGKNLKSFAIIGDYGIVDAGCELLTINLLQRLQSNFGNIDFLLSTGDNAYWNGNCNAFEKSVLPFFQEYFPKGHKCNDTHPKIPKHIGLKDLSQTKYFPTLGNHDWKPQKDSNSIIPYFQVFPHLAQIDELYLDSLSRKAHGLPPRKDLHLLYGGFYQHSPIPGMVDVFVVNSNLGNKQESETYDEAYKLQGEWLERALEISDASFKIVVTHHPPFSTAVHDPPANHMRYPYKKWGVDLVLSGHQHVYERMNIDNVTHVINGLGGHHWRYEIEHCKEVVEGSRKRYNKAHGLMYGVVSKKDIALCFYSVEDKEHNGVLIDEFLLESKSTRTS